jgi:hypothetical protein
MDEMTLYRCAFKNSPRARTTRTMSRWYENDDRARTDWAKQVAEMTGGRGVVLSVDADQDPMVRIPYQIRAQQGRK